jgi:hypothetical protein
LIKPNDSNLEITSIQKDEDDLILPNLGESLYVSTLTFKSISVSYVGYYYCVFNETLEFDPDYEYAELVHDYKASDIYVFVNGKICQAHKNCRIKLWIQKFIF